MVRTRNNNNSNSNGRSISHDFLKPDETAFSIHKSIVGTERVIAKAIKHYDMTGDLYALKIAFDGYVTLGEMLRQVQGLYSYGHSYGP